MNFLVSSETSKLKLVIIGIANSNGIISNIDDLYDPKSIENLKKGTYPKESDMILELDSFVNVLNKHNVTVYRPKLINNYNQIFVRDIGFVIDNFFFKSNILPKRSKEFQAIDSILSSFNDKIIQLPKNVHVEGGDVLYHDNLVFIGYYDKDDYSNLFTARTNKKAIEYFLNFFPKKKIIPLHLNKSLNDPKKNILHLDCCLQIVGNNKAIIHPDAFTYKKDYLMLIELFGEKNIFEINDQEMYEMTSNILSIDNKTVVTQSKFKRLNNWLKSNDFLLEEVNFTEVSKQEGLFRCTSLPLIRYNE